MIETRLLLVSLLLLCCACGGEGSATPPAGDLNTTRIADVQGPGSSSAIEGQTVTVRGVVTGDFQDNDDDSSSDLGGFFIQSEQPDDNASTSEGLFVFDGANPETDVNTDDVVIVTGLVQEHFGETQIAASEVDVTGRGSVQSTDIQLPFRSLATNSDGDPIADLERFEGMRVHFPQTLTISELFNIERFGSIRLSQGGRLYQFTNTESANRSAYDRHKNSNARRSIELDDGRRKTNVVPIRFLNTSLESGTATRVGDTVTNLMGNLRYSRGSGGSGTETWRIMPSRMPVIDSENPRPQAPVVGGELRVASFNVLNYFSSIDSGQRSCGPVRNDGCRGADSSRELSRQRAKIVAALAMIDADIVGLIELENNASESLNDIVAALNANVGAGTYASLETGTIGNDAIKTGLIFKPNTVALFGDFKLLDSTIDPRFDSNRNRPALAQAFTEKASNERLTVVVNHLKSKGSDCNDDGDPNRGDGQGNCNLTRTRAAEALADWIKSDPTGSGDSDALIIGDLNAYLREDPITAMEKADLINLIDSGEAYSFVFDGQSGALDHALATQSLEPQVVDAVEWHINADEAPVHDYNLEHGRDADIFDGDTPYRASDHDPVIIGLDLR